MWNLVWQSGPYTNKNCHWRWDSPIAQTDIIYCIDSCTEHLTATPIYNYTHPRRWLNTPVIYTCPWPCNSAFYALSCMKNMSATSTLHCNCKFYSNPCITAAVVASTNSYKAIKSRAHNSLVCEPSHMKKICQEYLHIVAMCIKVLSPRMLHVK